MQQSPDNTDAHDSAPGAVGSRLRLSWRPQASAPALALVTTVLWSSVLAAGLLGLGITPAVPPPAPPAPLPLQVEVLEVELTDDALPVIAEAPPATPSLETPPPLALLEAPVLPALQEVAAPDAIVAFPLPVTGPVRVVETGRATYARPVEATQEIAVPSGLPEVRTLVHGQGEGRQPKPEYPRQALRERQEGTVVVRFSVGTNGRVHEATLTERSPWPLLNESALRVIRDRWRFAGGDVRVYEVAIRFEL
jgi:periplasmic protein TonB